jgi:hypothetical protein
VVVLDVLDLKMPPVLGRGKYILDICFHRATSGESGALPLFRVARYTANWFRDKSRLLTVTISPISDENVLSAGSHNNLPVLLSVGCLPCAF